MKQKDILMIIAIAGVSTIFAFVVANLLISSPKNRQYKVQILDSISSSFPEADSRYFNKDSLDPTQQVQIGAGGNSQPFAGSK
jgi:hypothetical protein